MTHLAVFDYGAGNLHSLVKAISTDERTISIETDLRTAMTADLLVLPGVGAFGVAASAMQNSQAYLAAALADGLPCLGICLGMQLLFDASEESPGKGIGFIPGNVTRLRTSKVPHMGWNDVEWLGNGDSEDRAIDDGHSVPKLETAYFANAYVCEPDLDSPILA
ncbi:MAG TPA: imidazole glycerol phosphate synthase subunit HisH, partial [Gemmatimonadaceae bacterium]|nr:imidazole glycerol phosphate synthase subunit HisH [Gemmatimonadaceae bacterium]